MMILSLLALLYVGRAVRVLNHASSHVLKRSIQSDGSTSSGPLIVSLGFGTPIQQIECIVDTGSNDIWIPLKGAPAVCASSSEAGDGVDCSDSANLFNPNISSTLKWTDTVFDDVYVGWQTTGIYVKDTITVNGIHIPNATFAVANSTTAPACIFGLAGPYLSDMATTLDNSGFWEPSYDTLPVLLYKLGHTQSQAISVYLGVNGEGSLSFGGIDLALVQGPLTYLPSIDPGNDAIHVSRPMTILSGISEVSSNGEISPIASLAYPTAFDTGYSGIDLPTDAVEALIAPWKNWTIDSTSGAIYGPCSSVDIHSTLELNFLGASVQLPLSELIYSVQDSQCSGVIFPSSDIALLGTQAMSYIYAAIGFEANQIVLGQANAVPIGSQVEDIIGNTVPSATTAAQYAATEISHDVTTYTRNYTLGTRS